MTENDINTRIDLLNILKKYGGNVDKEIDFLKNQTPEQSTEISKDQLSVEIDVLKILEKNGCSGINSEIENRVNKFNS